MKIGGEAGGGCAVVDGAGGVYMYVLADGGGGDAAAVAGTAADGEGAAVTEEPPLMPGTGAGAPARWLTHTTLLVRARRPVSARRTTAVDVEWLLTPGR